MGRLCLNKDLKEAKEQARGIWGGGSNLGRGESKWEGLQSRACQAGPGAAGGAAWPGQGRERRQRGLGRRGAPGKSRRGLGATGGAE